jgi:hypothetical protein
LAFGGFGGSSDEKEVMTPSLQLPEISAARDTVTAKMGPVAPGSERLGKVGGDWRLNEQASTPLSDRGKLPSVPSIEAASLSSTIGLVVVLENEGSLELFALARHVDLELMQLLLVVKAGEILGWITTPGGRDEMTTEGRHFLASGIRTRQQLLNATLRHLFVFDLLVQIFRKVASREVNETVALSQFALTFPHERPQRIMRTVVTRARYAELFRYSRTRKIFYSLQTPHSACSDQRNGWRLGLSVVGGQHPIAVGPFSRDILMSCKALGLFLIGIQKL